MLLCLFSDWKLLFCTLLCYCPFLFGYNGYTSHSVQGEEKVYLMANYSFRNVSFVRIFQRDYRTECRKNSVTREIYLSSVSRRWTPWYALAKAMYVSPAKTKKKRRGREDFGTAEILFFSASILSRWKTKQLRIPKTLLRHLNLLFILILYKTFLSFVSCRLSGQCWQFKSSFKKYPKSSSLSSVF